MRIYVSRQLERISTEPFKGSERGNLSGIRVSKSTEADKSWLSFGTTCTVPEDFKSVEKLQYDPRDPTFPRLGKSVFSYPVRIRILIDGEEFSTAEHRFFLPAGTYPATVTLSGGWSGRFRPVFITVHTGENNET